MIQVFLVQSSNITTLSFLKIFITQKEIPYLLAANPLLILFFFNFYSFIYFFVALGLRCCARAFSSWG